jgi:hypothetical protein
VLSLIENTLPAMVNATQNVNNSRSSQNDRSYSSNTEVFTDDLPDKESKEEFYLDKMPPPWNVMPRSAEKEADEIKLVQNTMNKKFEGTEEGKYFEWRPSVVECIHKANMGLNRKYLMLSKYLDTDKSLELADMVPHINFSPATYLNLILALEQRYGGQFRAFNFVKLRLLNGNKLNLRDLKSVNEVRNRVLAFVDHCYAHDQRDYLDSDAFMDDVNNSLLSENLLQQLWIDRLTLGLEEPLSSIKLIAEWLDVV